MNFVTTAKWPLVVLLVLLTRGRPKVYQTSIHPSILCDLSSHFHQFSKGRTHALRGDLESNQPNVHVPRFQAFYFEYLFCSSHLFSHFIIILFVLLQIINKSAFSLFLWKCNFFSSVESLRQIEFECLNIKMNNYDFTNDAFCISVIQSLDNFDNFTLCPVKVFGLLPLMGV